MRNVSKAKVANTCVTVGLEPYPSERTLMMRLRMISLLMYSLAFVRSTILLQGLLSMFDV